MRHLATALTCLLALTGCTTGEHEDIKQWMREQSKDMRGRVPRLPEIKPFPPVAYDAGAQVSPFSPGKIVTADASLGNTAPDRDRPLQPLENFPLEDLKVVGIILSGKAPYALIQTPPPNKPKSVLIGEFMGQNFGKIVAIDKEGVTVRETIKDINGAWVEQEQTLPVLRAGVSQ